MITERKAANAVGGKTARACDSCMCKRARWYCTADDAFLCQACDASVHSANSLARRHERVRLKTASLKATGGGGGGGGAIDGKAAAEKSLLTVPAWHQGFRRKARTPRHGKPMLQQQQNSKSEEPSMSMSSLPLVPEIGNDETSPDDENDEEQLLYRVPIFDPFVAEFCSSMIHNDVSNTISPTTTNDNNNHVPSIIVNHSKPHQGDDNYGHVVDFDENFPGVLLPSDMDLTEFAADVETLLGTGLDEDSFCMESLGLLDSKEEASTLEYCFGMSNEKFIKVEEDEEEETMEGARGRHGADHHHNHNLEIDISRETLDLNFDYDSPTTGEEEEEKVVGTVPMMMMNNSNGYNYEAQETTKSVALKLNYDAVIAAWASQGSPWTTGDRPKVNPDDCWPDCLGGCHMNHTHHQQQHHHHHYADAAGVGGSGHVGGAMLDDGGREARVSRYREKRRTRLFSKKIRYEVRKLNAEKRPRMKGRFVKRTSSSSSSFMGPSAVASTGLPFC